MNRNKSSSISVLSFASGGIIISPLISPKSPVLSPSVQSSGTGTRARVCSSVVTVTQF